MKYASILTLALVYALGCGSKAPETEVAAPEPAVEPAPPPPPPEPTEEEKKKAEELKKLEEDRAKMKADHDTDVTRWTPELHAEAKAVAEKDYATGKAAIKAALAGKYREPGNADRDKARHPVETLEFFGFKPNQTVLEFGPGGGWYTELLAPSLAKKGKLIITGSDPNGPADQRSTLNGERQKLWLETSPELYSKVEVAYIDNKAPALAQEGTVDLIVCTRELHGMVNGGTLDAWLKEFHDALKAKGTLGIEQHRAKPDAVPEESAKKGYLPEKFVIEKVEAAGFKLAGKSEINANPKDTKDYEKGVWTLPPNFAAGDADKEKYAAIGESDRMTLKFTKK
ncbi:MAG TPA: methyltransferase domain-containing protein [Polyangiaceae bacterium]|nr:methyltransferase domain-containing protein [Polyangiaceae bacterium]